MKKDLNDLKQITDNLKKENKNTNTIRKDIENLEELYEINSKKEVVKNKIIDLDKKEINTDDQEKIDDKYHFAEEIKEEETLSIHDKELELIIKALERNHGKRKPAADELGISERTLYRKIKQHDIEL